MSTVHHVGTSFHNGLPLAAILIGITATLAWNIFLVYLAVTLVRRFI